MGYLCIWTSGATQPVEEKYRYSNHIKHSITRSLDSYTISICYFILTLLSYFCNLNRGIKIEFCELVRFDNVAKSGIYNSTCRKFIDVCMRLPDGNTHAPHSDTHTQFKLRLFFSSSFNITIYRQKWFFLVTLCRKICKIFFSSWFPCTCESISQWFVLYWSIFRNSWIFIVIVFFFVFDVVVVGVTSCCWQALLWIFNPCHIVELHNQMQAALFFSRSFVFVFCSCVCAICYRKTNSVAFKCTPMDYLYKCKNQMRGKTNQHLIPVRIHRLDIPYGILSKVIDNKYHFHMDFIRFWLGHFFSRSFWLFFLPKLSLFRYASIRSGFISFARSVTWFRFRYPFLRRMQFCIHDIFIEIDAHTPKKVYVLNFSLSFSRCGHKRFAKNPK